MTKADALTEVGKEVVIQDNEPWTHTLTFHVAISQLDWIGL